MKYELPLADPPAKWCPFCTAFNDPETEKCAYCGEYTVTPTKVEFEHGTTTVHFETTVVNPSDRKLVVHNFEYGKDFEPVKKDKP